MIVRSLAGLALAVFAMPAAAAGILVTGSQQPYPVEYQDTAPNDATFVRAIGIYEANSGHGPGNNPMYDATINVEGQGANKLYLVLGSYEPVRWNLTGAGLKSVKGVLVTGYNQHQVTGISAALVENISGGPPYNGYFGATCYTISSCSGLLSFAAGHYGDQVDSLAATYNANAFTVLATGPAGVPEPAQWGLLIAGFGIAGGAMRRRGARRQRTI